MVTTALFPNRWSQLPYPHTCWSQLPNARGGSCPNYVSRAFHRLNLQIIVASKKEKEKKTKTTPDLLVLLCRQYGQRVRAVARRVCSGIVSGGVVAHH